MILNAAFAFDGNHGQNIRPDAHTAHRGRGQQNSAADRVLILEEVFLNDLATHGMADQNRFFTEFANGLVDVFHIIVNGKGV